MNLSYILDDRTFKEIKLTLGEGSLIPGGVRYKRGNCTISMYNKSRKILLQGHQDKSLEWLYQRLKLVHNNDSSSDQLVCLMKGSHIGTDETGKGDIFGPLIVCSFYTTDETSAILESLGVKDSKSLPDHRVREISEKIKKDPRFLNNYVLTVMYPQDLDTLYKSYNNNYNDVLACLHLKTSHALSCKVGCNRYVFDDFGKGKFISGVINLNNQDSEVISVTKGERDIAVASASIMARAELMFQFDDMRNRYDMDIPFGAGDNAKSMARAFRNRYGIKELSKLVKNHFKIYNELTNR